MARRRIFEEYYDEEDQDLQDLGDVDDDDFTDEEGDLEPGDAEDDEPRGDEDDEPDPEDEDDDFSDVDPEVAGRLDRAADKKAKKLANEYKSRMGRGVRNLVEQLQAAGIEVTADGKIVPPAPQRRSRREDAEDEEQPQQRRQPQQEEPQFTLENMPDPTLETEDYLKWLKGYTKAQNDATTAQNRILQNEVMEIKAERAVSTARRILPQYGLGEIAKHPKFDELMERALLSSNLPVQQWKDPDTLARIAAIVSVDLRKQPVRKGKNSFLDTLLDDERPTRRRQRDEDEEDEPRSRRPEVRRQGERARRSAIARNGAQQIGVTRPSGRAPRNEGRYSALDRAVAKELNISLREAASLDDPTGEAFLRERARSGRQNRVRR